MPASPNLTPETVHKSELWQTEEGFDVTIATDILSITLSECDFCKAACVPHLVSLYAVCTYLKKFFSTGQSFRILLQTHRYEG
jgi:hypothetical protein